MGNINLKLCEKRRFNMDKSNAKNKKEVIKGRIKGTSAFDIEQADEISDISWSNNNYDHSKDNNNCQHNK
ncbi:hypothetical protein HMPREF1982_01576 [Clostridiales bacterium oral taxon 876 str. F0540]|nr:hypothetical protein HMPREF1982_01576 [Clostridiales bacterium oral taxon 876 str. F0540]